MQNAEDNEVVKQVGLGLVVSPADSRTSIEVVQSERNTTSGTIGLYCSHSALSAVFLGWNDILRKGMIERTMREPRFQLHYFLRSLLTSTQLLETALQSIAYSIKL